MTYNTVTVTPTLSANISVVADINPNIISVIPSIHQEIDVDAELHDNLIDIVPTLHDNIIEAETDFYSKIKTYEAPVEYYRGSYEFTPTQATQTVTINGLMPTRDITINPIPSNYGLITWDGSTLTVS